MMPPEVRSEQVDVASAHAPLGGSEENDPLRLGHFNHAADSKRHCTRRQVRIPAWGAAFQRPRGFRRT